MKLSIDYKHWSNFLKQFKRFMHLYAVTTEGEVCVCVSIRSNEEDLHRMHQRWFDNRQVVVCHHFQL